MIELMLVVVILGIVGGMAFPRIHDIIIQQRIASAATVVQNNVEAAFAIASRNRQPVRVSWAASTMQLGVTDRAGTVYYRKVGLGKDSYGLDSAHVAFSRSPLEIYPNGLANDTLTITLSGTNVTKKIRMTRAGLVRIE